MASFGFRSFRCFSRSGQAFCFGSKFRSQGRSILRSQNVRCQLLRQFCLEASVTRQVSSSYFNSVARIVSTCPLAGLQQTTSLCLISAAAGSGDLIEGGGGGDDDGLVIPAAEEKKDL